MVAEMKSREAESLISAAVTHQGGVWADLGAGSGTFTKALAGLLGERGVIYAVDRIGGVLPSGAEGQGNSRVAEIVPLLGDFREPLALADLDGVVMANSLHFIATSEQRAVVERLVSYLKPGGAFVIVEYDQGRGNNWVPFPVAPQRFAELAAATGLLAVREIGRLSSRFGPKDIYASMATRPPGPASASLSD